MPYNRICFTFSRGFGNAVARNRAKRLGREAFRLIKSRLCAGFDLILQVFPNAAPFNIKKDAKMTLSDRTEQLEILFSKAGLFK